MYFFSLSDHNSACKNKQIVCQRIVEEAAKQTVTKNGLAAKSGRKDHKSRALTELAPNGNLSCLLTTADPDMATRTHFLYETGGNIGKISNLITYGIIQTLYETCSLLYLIHIYIFFGF